MSAKDSDRNLSVFPTQGVYDGEGDQVRASTPGMSLRRWLIGQIANGDAAGEPGWDSNSNVSDSQIKARVTLYCRIADAIMEATK